MLTIDVLDAPEATSSDCALLSIWREVLTCGFRIETELSGGLERADKSIDKVHVGGHNEDESRE